LLLLLVIWFPAAIVVARVRLLWGRKATMEQEETLAALTAGDAATPVDLATADDVALDLQDTPPTGPLATAPDDSKQTSPLDAPTQPSSNDVSGAPDAKPEAAPRDTADTADKAPTDAHEAPSNLDIPID
jgi:hypothetical protein